MGEANSDSTIALKLNKLARERLKAMAASDPDGAVANIASSLASAVNTKDGIAEIATGTGAQAAVGQAYTDLSVTPPAQTNREIKHLTKEVPRDILVVSKHLIGQVVSNNWPATYSTANGQQWDVKLVTMVDKGRVEASVTWTNAKLPKLGTPTVIT